jgi:DNA repair exonuclease SbcCD ATPase subunit
VKIKGTCRFCGREFLAEQITGNGGHCPWCGQPFQSDYAAVLVDALQDAELAGTTLESALEKIADMNPAFDLDEDSILEPFRKHLERLDSGARTGVRA